MAFYRHLFPALKAACPFLLPTQVASPKHELLHRLKRLSRFLSNERVDPDEVSDLVSDRLVELQVEERVPVYVIPVRTPELILAELQAEAGRRPQRRERTFPLLGRIPPPH